jgi:hypothetical protein
MPASSKKDLSVKHSGSSTLQGLSDWRVKKLALSYLNSVRQISEHLRSASLEIDRLDGGKQHVSFIEAANQQDFISEHSLIAKT